MGEAVFEEMRAYLLKRQNTVAQYIAAQPILDLCEETVRRSGVRVARRRWDQEGLNLAGARAAAAASDDGEGGG